MKKYLLIFCMLLMPAMAQEDIFEQTIELGTRPTDAEIKATIDKFNFDENQKARLFKETKKRIDDIYDKKEKQSQDCALPVVEPNKDGAYNIKGFDINKIPVEKPKNIEQK